MNQLGDIGSQGVGTQGVGTSVGWYQTFVNFFFCLTKQM